MVSHFFNILFFSAGGHFDGHGVLHERAGGTGAPDAIRMRQERGTSHVRKGRRKREKVRKDGIKKEKTLEKVGERRRKY